MGAQKARIDGIYMRGCSLSHRVEAHCILMYKTHCILKDKNEVVTIRCWWRLWRVLFMQWIFEGPQNSSCILGISSSDHHIIFPGTYCYILFFTLS